MIRFGYVYKDQLDRLRDMNKAKSDKNERGVVLDVLSKPPKEFEKAYAKIEIREV